MIIRYYKNENLTYTSRKRYASIPTDNFFAEEQKAVLLGDGATTSIKTIADNICDYVTIDNTRWFVTSYKYMNGKQIEMFLQRDVVGEFGFYNCYGKIERGYTESLLRNRKELGLNQILKKRQSLIPNTNTYGNFSVDNHNNELWGVLYFSYQSGLQDDTLNVIIPAFSPQTVSLQLINPQDYIYSVEYNTYISFNVVVSFDDYYRYANKNIKYFLTNSGNGIQVSAPVITNFASTDGYNIQLRVSSEGAFTTSATSDYIIEDFANQLKNRIITSITNNPNYNVPVINTVPYPTGYNNVNIVDENDNSIYNYSTTFSQETTYSTIPSGTQVYDDVSLAGSSFRIDRDGFFVARYEVEDGIEVSYLKRDIYMQKATINRIKLTPEEAGTIPVKLNSNIVDEPYTILVVPLFNCNISGEENFSITKSRGFSVFNGIISSLSGDNPYLVDAQVIPYCPVLTSVAARLEGFPIFNVASGTYSHTININLLPYSNIKKEYICREYSIVSPEQSDKFSFNFYDYKTTVLDQNGINMSELSIEIKIALKPFSIIASAVIIPEEGSLINMTYPSSLIGCQPSSNGFECSLSTNQFQQYVRNNSNYEKIFNKNQQYLKKQQDVEAVNETTAAIVNSISAASMGAIAGASMADVGWLGNAVGAKALGAVGGAALAGGTVGLSMATQKNMNDELRQYEYNLQQEMFDFEIGTIKNLPNNINRISSFNEIILKDFWFIVETYECSNFEISLVDEFIQKYSYGIGIFGNVSDFVLNGWFIRGTLITSNYNTNLHNIAEKELKGGIYYYGN